MEYVVSNYGYDFAEYCGLDENGKPVERSKNKYPYSYDGYVIWRNGHNYERENTAYSDRLRQFDHEKYDKCWAATIGDKGNYDTVGCEKLTEFLCAYFGYEVKIIFLMQYCNVSNGYPYWRIDYKKL